MFTSNQGALIITDRGSCHVLVRHHERFSCPSEVRLNHPIQAMVFSNELMMVLLTNQQWYGTGMNNSGQLTPLRTLLTR